MILLVTAPSLVSPGHNITDFAARIVLITQLQCPDETYYIIIELHCLLLLHGRAAQ